MEEIQCGGFLFAETLGKDQIQDFAFKCVVLLGSGRTGKDLFCIRFIKSGFQEFQKVFTGGNLLERFFECFRDFAVKELFYKFVLVKKRDLFQLVFL